MAALQRYLNVAEKEKVEAIAQGDALLVTS